MELGAPAGGASVAEQIEIIRRGAAEIISEDELGEKLRRSRETGVPLRVKAGFDPTAADLHLGHTVLLRKLRQFQDLGHEVLFLIGDFTGIVGDPTGRSETRKALTREEVLRNAETYRDQVFKILDPERTRVVCNSEWLSKLTPPDFIRLAARMTVARMLERDDFSKRYREGRPISIHEFLYPLLQGYDSVVLKADVEIGGTDQKFNLLVGRDLQRESGQPPQVVVTLPLLEGTDGVQKMSKSFGNSIGLAEPPTEMFGKVMSIPDAVMLRYYDLLSSLSPADLADLKTSLESGQTHPMAAKKSLAQELVARFHGDEAARRAREEFDRVFGSGGAPDQVPDVVLDWEGRPWVPKVIHSAGLASSLAEAKRLLAQGAVVVDGERISDPEAVFPVGVGSLVKVGKRRFARVKLVPKKS
ncbi:MAG: tyrosine--tRNA ligase [Nitrospirota bacterium]